MKLSTFISTTVAQLIAWLLFYSFIGGSTWHQNKLKEIIFVFVVFILTSIWGTFTYFFRPLTITLTQRNVSHPDLKNTVIDIQGEKLVTKQNQRTISYSIKIERRGSIWWRLFKKLLKFNDLVIQFSSSPYKMGLVQDTYTNHNIVPNQDQGFNYGLNEYFHELFKGSGNYTIFEKHHYFITAHPDFNYPPNATYIIEPTLTFISHNRSAVELIAATLSKSLIKITELEKHEITVVKR
ncbi:hypothetical protein [Fictibacillus barbaricus]|uniref:DUF3137 domain-containing protein n=1 Tax=Fictibacillus barbaricus TaxID=182136 RepID=A0ABS2ZMU7_9BACL|nr:hypothetical protein [Fictibacillus barbaricus]MBN3547985.1 hypothetical protein [Fictibacillus barbaricus]GGB53090.1 hypothetical protein GCM10007199_18700 [Fictibacillus barbaricus]